MTDDNVRYLPRIGIGEAMRLYGLTARAIRFYEEKGLVEPRRDRTNARYFDGVARRRLAWIAQLRKAGVSLAEIEEVLAAEEAGGHGRERAAASLEKRRQTLRAELEQVETALAELTLPAPRSLRA